MTCNENPIIPCFTLFVECRFADVDATTGGRPSIICHYGKDTGDQVMQKFGAFPALKQGWGEEKPGGKPDEQIMQLLYLDEIKNAKIEEALIGDF